MDAREVLARRDVSNWRMLPDNAKKLLYEAADSALAALSAEGFLVLKVTDAAIERAAKAIHESQFEESWALLGGIEVGWNKDAARAALASLRGDDK